MMSLAVALSLLWDTRRAAKALGLPLSTIYRWLAAYRRDPTAFGDQLTSEERLRQLTDECRAKGFDVLAGSSEAALSAHLPRGHGSDSMHAAANGEHSRSTKARPIAAPNQVSRIADRATENGWRRSNDLVESARRTIDQHYYAKLCCDELASATGMSKWHFIRSFRAGVGVSPYQYLTSVRIQRAKYLLRTTDHSLDAIASAVGFDTLSCLCRAFKKIEGVTLSSFYGGTRMGYVADSALESAGSH